MGMKFSDEWGSDPISTQVSTHVATMPNRPLVVVAVVVFGRSRESKIIRTVARVNGAQLSTQWCEFVGIPYLIVSFGLHDETPAVLARLVVTMDWFRWNGGALYVNGNPVFSYRSGLQMGRS